MDYEVGLLECAARNNPQASRSVQKLPLLIITTISTWAREMEKIFAQNFLLKCQFSQQMNFARLDAVEIAFLVIEEREYADT